MAEVTVTRTADGAIRIAAGPDARSRPAFAHRLLDVAGGLLVWPDLDGAGPPAADLDEPHLAQQWLWAVYGEQVAVACGPGDPGTVTVPAEPTRLAEDAARLGYGHWAARWWPASHLDGIPPLDDDLLGLELAALTYRCQQLFDPADEAGVDGDRAADLIAEHQGGIDSLVHRWTTAATPLAGPIETVLRLVGAAAENAGQDGPALRRLWAALDDDTAADPGVPARTGERAEYALAAGVPTASTGRVIDTGYAVNDWSRYPPGFVDAAEDAVSWVAHATGARRRITVSAVAGPVRPAPGVSLVAEVGVAAGPVRRVPMDWHDHAWTGAADLVLPPVGPAGITVAVLLPGFDPGAGDDAGPADRDAVRDTARRRLAAADLPDAFLAEIFAAGRAA